MINKDKTKGDFTRRQCYLMDFTDFNRPMWRTKSQTDIVISTSWILRNQEIYLGHIKERTSKGKGLRSIIKETGLTINHQSTYCLDDNC